MNLEKLVFLEMTNKSMALLPNKDYFDTFSQLTENEKAIFGQLSEEIHTIWTEINCQPIPGLKEKIANSVSEYDELIERVNPLIMKCYNDFGITLKNEITPDLKASIIRILGKDFYDKHFTN